MTLSLKKRLPHVLVVGDAARKQLQFVQALKENQRFSVTTITL